jgi:hypothetical protein
LGYQGCKRQLYLGYFNQFTTLALYLHLRQFSVDMLATPLGIRPSRQFRLMP